MAGHLRLELTLKVGDQIEGVTLKEEGVELLFPNMEATEIVDAFRGWVVDNLKRTAAVRGLANQWAADQVETSS